MPPSLGLVVLLVTLRRKAGDAGAGWQGRRESAMAPPLPRPRTPPDGDRRAGFPAECCEKGHYRSKAGASQADRSLVSARTSSGSLPAATSATVTRSST